MRLYALLTVLPGAHAYTVPNTRAFTASSDRTVAPRPTIIRSHATLSTAEGTAAALSANADADGTDYDALRFEGTHRLYGGDARANLERARVLVIGLGGVGSWAVEALARSGVGALVLVDLDELCISNTNRQLHALSSTVGRSKARTLAARVAEL